MFCIFGGSVVRRYGEEKTRFKERGAVAEKAEVCSEKEKEEEEKVKKKEKRRRIWNSLLFQGLRRRRRAKGLRREKCKDQDCNRPSF